MVIPRLPPTQHEDTVVDEGDPVVVTVDPDDVVVVVVVVVIVVVIILQLSVWQHVVVTPAIVPAEQIAEHDWTTTDIPDDVVDVVCWSIKFKAYFLMPKLKK